MPLNRKTFSTNRTCLDCGRDLKDNEYDICNKCRINDQITSHKIFFTGRKTDLSGDGGHKISLASESNYNSGYNYPSSVQTSYYSNNTIEREMVHRSGGFIPTITIVIFIFICLTVPGMPTYNPDFVHWIQGILSSTSNLWNNNTAHSLTITLK